MIRLIAYGSQSELGIMASALLLPFLCVYSLLSASLYFSSVLHCFFFWLMQLWPQCIDSLISFTDFFVCDQNRKDDILTLDIVWLWTFKICDCWWNIYGTPCIMLAGHCSPGSSLIPSWLRSLLSLSSLSPHFDHKQPMSLSCLPIFHGMRDGCEPVSDILNRLE